MCIVGFCGWFTINMSEVYFSHEVKKAETADVRPCIIIIITSLQKRLPRGGMLRENIWSEHTNSRHITCKGLWETRVLFWLWCLDSNLFFCISKSLSFTAEYQSVSTTVCTSEALQLFRVNLTHEQKIVKKPHQLLVPRKVSAFYRCNIKSTPTAPLTRGLDRRQFKPLLTTAILSSPLHHQGNSPGALAPAPT